MKLIHTFNQSLSREMQVPDAPPEKGQCHIQSVEWTGRPKRKHEKEYVRFCHVVNSHLADCWQISILHIIQASLKIRACWERRPGQPQKRSGNINAEQGVL